MPDVIVKDRGKGKSTLLIDAILEYKRENPDSYILIVIPHHGYRSWWTNRLWDIGISTIDSRIDFMTPNIIRQGGLRGFNFVAFAEDVEQYPEGIYEDFLQYPMDLICVTASPIPLEAIQAEVERLNKPKLVRRITARQKDDLRFALTACATIGINPKDVPVFSTLWNMLNPIGELIEDGQG